MEIRLARHGRHIAIVTIDNQPRLNAMTRAILAELGRLWDELQRDESCRAIVLTGAGTRAFTVGADIAGDLSAGPEIARMVNHALLKTDAYAKPIIAAINGDCVGGGLELMLASDVRAAAPEARFGLTEVKWSIYPFGGSTTKLVHQLGYVHAMDLLLTARLIDAEEAARCCCARGAREASRPKTSTRMIFIFVHYPSSTCERRLVAKRRFGCCIARLALIQAIRLLRPLSRIVRCSGRIKASALTEGD